jgi:hypothetical protein
MKNSVLFLFYCIFLIYIVQEILWYGVDHLSVCQYKTVWFLQFNFSRILLIVFIFCL